MLGFIRRFPRQATRPNAMRLIAPSHNRTAFSNSQRSSAHRRRRLSSGLGKTISTVAFATVVTTGAATSVGLCATDKAESQSSINWALTLGVSAVAAAAIGTTVAFLSGNDEKSEEVDAASKPTGVKVDGCKVLPMPPLGKWTEGSPKIELDNHCNTKVTWGVASAQGRRRYMEDEWCAGVLVPNVVNAASGGEQQDSNKSEELTSQPLYVAAVFDGHGGGACSRRASREMMREMSNAISSTTDISSPQNAIASALSSLEAQMVGTEALTCGTTAIVVAITHDGKMVVANVGDSRAIICSGAGCNFKGDPLKVDAPLLQCDACALSEDHKPGNEKERIEAAGGCVKREFIDRVYLNSGDYSGKGGLAMSRALGDKFFKIAPYVQDEARPIVSPDPDFQMHRVNENDAWCILASDGLWDVVSPQRICDILSKNVEGHKNDAQVVASELVKYALKQPEASDNITVLALRFDHQNQKVSESEPEAA